MGRTRFTGKWKIYLFAWGNLIFNAEIFFLGNRTFHRHFIFFLQISISFLFSFSICTCSASLYDQTHLKISSYK